MERSPEHLHDPAATAANSVAAKHLRIVSGAQRDLETEIVDDHLGSIEMSAPSVTDAGAGLQGPNRKKDDGLGFAMVANEVHVAPTPIERLRNRKPAAQQEPESRPREEPRGEVRALDFARQRDALVELLERDSKLASERVRIEGNLQRADHAHTIPDAFVVRAGSFGFGIATDMEYRASANRRRCSNPSVGMLDKQRGGFGVGGIRGFAVACFPEGSPEGNE